MNTRGCLYLVPSLRLELNLNSLTLADYLTGIEANNIFYGPVSASSRRPPADDYKSLICWCEHINSLYNRAIDTLIFT